MEHRNTVDIDLFEAFLTEDDPGTARLLAELLGIPSPDDHVIDLVAAESVAGVVLQLN